MSDFVKMPKAEMARLMLEGKTLEIECGYQFVFDEKAYSPFRVFNSSGQSGEMGHYWSHPCRVKEAPKWKPKFRELVLVRDYDCESWLPAEYGTMLNDRHLIMGGTRVLQVAPFSEALMGTTDPIPGQLGGK